jgi:hypothetical protein
MQRHRALLALAILMIFLVTGTVGLMAQDANRPRPLANGVLKTIDTDLDPRDMFSLPMPLPRLNATKFDPKTVSVEHTLHGQSRRVIMFRENVWQYEFAFTGLRQAKLKIPNASGGLSNKNVWYMVYRVRDTGKTMTFEQVKQDPEFDHMMNKLKLDQPLPSEEKKFLPRFTLEGWIATPKGDGYQKVVYRDAISPVVLEQIRQREDENQVLLDSHQMSTAKIPVAKNASDPGVWGVAIWEDVDPSIDFVSVYIQGLTNAFRLGRSIDDPSKLKTLQLNFWRPGDSVSQQDDWIDFGIPLIDDPQKQALICERYDLPGPLIRAYHVDKVAKRNVLVVEADAEVNLTTFKSALTPVLDQGKLPPAIAQAFAESGITIDKGAALKTIIPGSKWSFKDGADEYIVALEPQFWEPDFVGIRFIKSLDHLWIYR